MNQRSELRKKAIRMLDQQSNIQLQTMIDIMTNGIKLYAPEGSIYNCWSNIPMEIITDHKNIGPVHYQCIPGRNLPGFEEEPDYIIEAEVPPVNFHVNYVKPKMTVLVSEYIQRNAEKYVAKPDYVLCGIEQVMLNKPGRYVYNGYIFYPRYNGYGSRLYVSEKDRENKKHGWSIATDKLKKIVHIGELEALERECKEYDEWCASDNQYLSD